MEALEAVARIVHFAECYCGEWPCEEAEDGAYQDDAQGFINMLATDGFAVVPQAPEPPQEAAE